MSMLFGVTTKEAANTTLSNGYDLHSWVMRMKGFPAFWGRSLSGKNRITPEEKAFLTEKSCKTALILDSLTEAQVSANNGSLEALCAVKAARELGVPANKKIALSAYIGSDWSVNHNWMISYAHTLLDNGYIPGFIGNTDSSQNFNFGRQCSHYVQFMRDIAKNQTIYWATEPKPKKTPPKWQPFCPSALTPGKIHLWKTGEEVQYGETALPLSYARDELVTRHMW